MLIQPAPRFSAFDVGDSVTANITGRCYRTVRSWVRADSAYLRFRQFALAVPHASGCPSLRSSVFVVVGAGAEEKMRGVDARRIVAAVANAQSLRDRPDPNFVGSAVRFLRLPSVAQYPIPQAVASPVELPTLTYDSISEPFDKRHVIRDIVLNRCLQVSSCTSALIVQFAEALRLILAFASVYLAYTLRHIDSLIVGHAPNLARLRGTHNSTLVRGH